MLQNQIKLQNCVEYNFFASCQFSVTIEEGHKATALPLAAPFQSLSFPIPSPYYPQTHSLPPAPWPGFPPPPSVPSVIFSQPPATFYPATAVQYSHYTPPATNPVPSHLLCPPHMPKEEVDCPVFPPFFLRVPLHVQLRRCSARIKASFSCNRAS